MYAPDIIQNIQYLYLIVYSFFFLYSVLQYEWETLQPEIIADS